ncbi:MAG: hypothetical protein J0I41_24405 [Filimonas sp.]|nr:hypothetical protein [Filimonas sp.]
MKTRKNKYLFVVILLIISNGVRAQVLVPPSNANFSSLEKNMLFYADRRFTVTQTGSAQVYLPAMFDGNYSPSYTPVAPSVSDPTVITIEGLPLEHTQRGAYVGWTTRYWPATKFKIEGFTGDNIWTTITDVSGYGGYEYMTYLHGVFSKLRFTFYTASGDNGLLGLSELFFLHSEAAQAYDGLMVKYDAKGNVGIGINNGVGKLSFPDVNATTEPIGIAWFNAGNDPTQYGIHRTAGSWSGPDFQQLRLGWHTGIIIDPGKDYSKSFLDVRGNGIRVTNGSVGIGTEDTKAYKLAVNGTAIFTKVVVKNYSNWPDYVFDSSYQLPSLDSVFSFIQVNKHLPDIPSAATVEKDGHDLGEVQKQLLKKVEEMTLYMIAQEKRIQQLEEENKAAKNRIQQLEVKHN